MMCVLYSEIFGYEHMDYSILRLVGSFLLLPYFVKNKTCTINNAHTKRGNYCIQFND